MKTAAPMPTPTVKDHPFFYAIGYAANILLVTSILLLLYGIAWEYATREYLKGFADAVVPFAASPERRVQAILSWMDHGPARNEAAASADLTGRDPEDTLNYAGLLRICGTATNAFVNLADSNGLEARRLLLLGSAGNTNHVVAEVYVGGRWVVVDPSFRAILRDDSGRLLTRQQLAQPEVFRQATRNLAGYDPDYNYAHTTHLRWASVPLVGRLLQRALDSFVPRWDESIDWTLLVERQSYAVLVSGLLLLVLALLSQRTLNLCGRKYLGVTSLSLRAQLQQGSRALFGHPLQHL